jgi:tRNA(adenine34) deaminase
MTINNATHNYAYWMKLALELAKKAEAIGEVPVGALIVRDGRLVSRGINRRETLHTPLGHAELIAIHRASQKLKAWRLTGCTLYVTLEPCIMCAGALVQARVDRIVFGALDSKGGGARSLYQLCEDTRLNHRIEVVGEVLADESAQLLKSFFKKRRSQK